MNTDKIDNEWSQSKHESMTAVEIEGCWCDPANWKLDFIYFCRQDPRVIVPKRVKGFGWTLNFAKPFALPVLVFTVILLLAPISLMLALGVTSKAWYITVSCMEIVSLCYLCNYFASSQRYADKP